MEVFLTEWMVDFLAYAGCLALDVVGVSRSSSSGIQSGSSSLAPESPTFNRSAIVADAEAAPVTKVSVVPTPVAERRESSKMLVSMLKEFKSMSVIPESWRTEDSVFLLQIQELQLVLFTDL